MPKNYHQSTHWVTLNLIVLIKDFAISDHFVDKTWPFHKIWGNSYTVPLSIIAVFDDSYYPHKISANAHYRYPLSELDSDSFPIPAKILHSPFMQGLVRSQKRSFVCNLCFSRDVTIKKLGRMKNFLFPVLWKLKKWCARAIFIFNLFFKFKFRCLRQQ